MTARELSRHLDVSMRTVYRDVEALCEAGVPLHMERGPLGGIVLASDYRRAIAHFTDEELQALFAVGPGPGPENLNLIVRVASHFAEDWRALWYPTTQADRMPLALATK